MISRGEPQRGQTLPIFAIAALFIIGVVALAVDFGFLTNQHRNLQAFADEAATAGALELGPNPGPTERTNARKAALIYLRENLNLGSTPSLSEVGSDCGTDFSTNVGTDGSASCPLRGTTYKVSIWSPAEPTGLGVSSSLSQTVSVRVSESVTTALAGLLSVPQVSVGALSVAQAGAAQPNYALYSDGCVKVLSSKTEVIAGDAYVNQCTVSPGSGAFCTYGEGPSNPTNPRLGSSAGDMTYGPYSTLAPTLVPLQTRAGCTSAAPFAGKQLATGSILHSGIEESPPTFAPPPSVPTCAPGTCAVALATAACLNGTRDSTGAPATGCFSPGAYTTIGPIANNLNPGVYHIYGDPSSSCTRSTNQTNCAAVYFSGNTFNANWPDVVDRCWGAPNVPVSGTFAGARCPDGFIDNPTAGISDPQCAPGCPATALIPPTFTVTPSASGGNLDPVGSGTTYYVRVTAYNNFGDSLSTERSVNVVSPTNTGSITINLTGSSPGATGYHVWGPSLTPGTELLNPVVLVGSAVVTDVPTGSALLPLFDTSACPGFCNLPGDLRSPGPQPQYGVTFVLDGKASVCVGHTTGSPPRCESDSPHPVVMLAPYCGIGFLSVGGVYQCNNAAVSANDGTFTFYGPTEGVVWAGTDSGTPGAFALTGLIDLPRAYLKIDATRFHLIPGQAILHHVDLNSSNALDPLVYTGHPPQPLIQVRIIR